MATALTSSPTVLRFTVYGKAEPQGSSRAFVPKGWKRPIITSSNPNLKPWRQQITQMAEYICSRGDAATPMFPTGPVEVTAVFYFDRPKSQSKRERLQPFKSTKPDCDKLARSLGDALTGVAYTDDSQIARLVAEKRFGSPARVEITVSIAGETE